LKASPEQELVVDRITRRIAAGAVAVSLAAVSVSASAERVDRGGRSQKVTSARIKDNTIQGRDLTASLRGSITSALHGVPASSVGTDQVAANSLTAADLAPGSVGASEVADGTLSSADVSSTHGVSPIDFGLIPANDCVDRPIDTFNTLNGDLLLVTPAQVALPGSVPPAAEPVLPYTITLTGRQKSLNGTVMDIVACNSTSAPVTTSATNVAWAVIEN
jgi:hypothetical protein